MDHILSTRDNKWAPKPQNLPNPELRYLELFVTNFELHFLGEAVI